MQISPARIHKTIFISVELPVREKLCTIAHNACFSRAPKVRRVEGEARNELEAFIMRLLDL